MRFVVLLISLMVFSCSDTRVESEAPAESYEPHNSSKQRVYEEIASITKMDNVKFDINVRTNKDIVRSHDFEIEASLLNSNEDTVYFLCMSCFGEKDLLEFDRAQLGFSQVITCNSSMPKIVKIGPGQSHVFKVKMYKMKPIKKIKLGFDFFSVSEDFRLISSDFINISDRPDSEKTIIWSEEKHLK